MADLFSDDFARNNFLDLKMPMMDGFECLLRYKVRK